MITLLGVAAYVLVWSALLARAQRSARDKLLPIFSVGLSCAVYLMSIPFEIAVRGGELYRRGDTLDRLSTFEQEICTLFGITILASFAWGIGLLAGVQSSSPRSTLDPRARRWETIRLTRTIMYSLVVVLGLSVSVFRDNVIQAGSYNSNVAQSVSSPAYMFTNQVAILLVASLVFLWLVHDEPRVVPALAACASLLVWSSYSNDKDPMVMGALALASAFLVNRRTTIPSLGWPLLTVLVPSVALVAGRIYSVARGGATPWRNVLSGAHSLTESSDAAGPFRSLVDAIRGTLGIDVYPGKSLVDVAALWVPRSVWPERPLDLSVLYAQANMDGWRPGFGLGFSLVADAISNAGWLGVPLLGYGLGRLARFFYERRHATAPLWGLVYYVGLPFVLFTCMRGPLVAMTNTLVHFLMGLWCVSLLHSRRESRRHGEPAAAAAR